MNTLKLNLGQNNLGNNLQIIGFLLKMLPNKLQNLELDLESNGLRNNVN